MYFLPDFYGISKRVFSVQGKRKNGFHGQVDLPGRNSGMVEHGFIGASMGIQHQTWGFNKSIWINMDFP